MLLTLNLWKESIGAFPQKRVIWVWGFIWSAFTRQNITNCARQMGGLWCFQRWGSLHQSEVAVRVADLAVAHHIQHFHKVSSYNLLSILLSWMTRCVLLHPLKIAYSIVLFSVNSCHGMSWIPRSASPAVGWPAGEGHSASHKTLRGHRHHMEVRVSHSEAWSRRKCN